jgi:hypothetical protein
MQVDGTASGVASAVAAGRSNRLVGLAFGPSTAQAFVEFSAYAAGGSSASGAFDAWSEFRPKDLFTGYGFDGTSISIPISSLLGITVEEADPVTGDWRELMRALLTTAHDYHKSFAWSARLRTFDGSMVQWFTNGYNAELFYTFEFRTDGETPPKVIPGP